MSERHLGVGNRLFISLPLCYSSTNRSQAAPRGDIYEHYSRIRERLGHHPKRSGSLFHSQRPCLPTGDLSPALHCCRRKDPGAATRVPLRVKVSDGVEGQVKSNQSRERPRISATREQVRCRLATQILWYPVLAPPLPPHQKSTSS